VFELLILDWFISPKFGFLCSFKNLKGIVYFRYVGIDWRMRLKWVLKEHMIGFPSLKWSISVLTYSTFRVPIYEKTDEQEAQNQKLDLLNRLITIIEFTNEVGIQFGSCQGV
jgi:hypothetical protein